jgi:hypothetical protein
MKNRDDINIPVGQHIDFVLNNTWQLGMVAIDDSVFEGEFIVNIMKRSSKGNSFI